MCCVSASQPAQSALRSEECWELQIIFWRLELELELLCGLHCSPASFRESVKANSGNPSLDWAQISRANYQFKFYKGREGQGGEDWGPWSVRETFIRVNIETLREREREREIYLVKQSGELSYYQISPSYWASQPNCSDVIWEIWRWNLCQILL